MYQIDKKDREIVNLLMEDGRMRSAEVARRLGNISERAVRYRLERLKSEGIIQVTAVVNPRPLGFTVAADVFIEVEPGYIQSVAEKLTEYECISYVACAIGQRDVNAQVLAQDNAEVFTFVTGVIGKIAGVRKTTTSIVPVILKDVFQWRIPESVCAEEVHDSTISRSGT
jgi:Lrp/AsnC family transcriptional regulator for asnA, asnC and gidA